MESPTLPRGPLESTQGDLTPECVGPTPVHRCLPGVALWDLRAHPPGPGDTWTQRACDTNPVTVQGAEQLLLVHEGGGTGSTIRSNPVSRGRGCTLSPRTSASRVPMLFRLLHCPHQPTSAPDLTLPLPSRGELLPPWPHCRHPDAFFLALTGTRRTDVGFGNISSEQ